MAEPSLDDDWEWLIGDANAKPVDVAPEMLDYEFIARSTSIDELRAILKALRKGDFGRYPDLEKEAKAKLIELLPAKEKRKAAALASKPSVADVNTEREGLQDWLAGVNTDKAHSKCGRAPKASSAAPVRAVTTANLGGSVDTVPIEDIAPAPSAVPNKEDAKIFRKEKLSTKEYFHRWDKYDVDAAVAALESDDEEELELDRKPKDQPNIEQADHTKEVTEILAGLTQAERTHMSIREREKGNEAFKAGENEEALCCYDRSILLDESNAKAYSNRAAVFVRQSKFDRSIEDCTKALTIEPHFLKARARRAMSYRKAERYEEAAADFAACHELKSDAGYDRLMHQSKVKLQERSKSYHSMVIHEVDDDSSCPGEEEDAYDYIEEVYTPGARSDEEQRSQDGRRSVKCEASSSFSANLKAHFSKEPAAATTAAAPEPSTQVVSESSDGTAAWHKVSIIDSDEESVQELATSLSLVAAAASTPAPEPSRQAASESSNGMAAWHKISIVETTDSDKDSTQEPRTSSSQRNDSNKLKEDGNDAMKKQRFDDAVKLYKAALEVDPSNIAALNNITVAHIKMEAWKESIADATSCLDIEPTNTKALYRRGYSKMMQSQKESSIEEALDDFRLALSFVPPKDQRKVLTKKVAECNRILSSLKAGSDTCKATGKKKVRSHDSQALAF